MTQELIIRCFILAALLGLVWLVSKRIQKGKTDVKSANGSLAVKDSLKLNFQTEVMVIEHNNVEYLLIGNQGDYRQLFKESVDFKKLSGGS